MAIGTNGSLSSQLVSPPAVPLPCIVWGDDRPTDSVVICWASQFGWMGITHATQWQSAVAVYLLGYISYGVTLVFYASIFPRLARNTAKTKKAREQLDNGEIAIEDYETTEMLERNRLSTISTAHSNCMWCMLA